jgi:dimethylhistidine N-methyltransferase
MIELAENIVPQRFTLIDADREERDSDFAAEVARGLGAQRKRLSCRHFYDAAGSQLFEQICALPEYYLTRAELSILVQHAADIAAAVAPGCTLVELGSGSATKTRILIAALLLRQPRLRYVPIDISRSMLAASSHQLLDDYPALEIVGVAAEYRAGLQLLQSRPLAAPAQLIVWLGSNVGNFTRDGAAAFLRMVRRAMGVHDRLLVGIDLRKPADVLERAYDDAAGVTAQFNRNLLARINRELDGDFVLEEFRHRACWNPRLGRVELYLESERAQRVRIGALGLDVAFAAGERIHTEDSYKYSPAEIDRLAGRAGLAVAARWHDDEERFSVNLMAPRAG